MSQSFEQFGKFILLEKLAAGGMAEVFLGKSLGASGVNKFLAVKRILPQYSDKREFIDMFKEEAKIAVNLNHGNVVSIYEFGIEHGQFYLVMEYVEGRNLRQVLNELKKKSHQFTIEQIVYMVKEVAAGLDHAHRLIDGTTGRPLNLVHRDMSPQNVMLSFEGEVKVIDFGIAKAETQMEATQAGTLKGKFGYMSPEQADGQLVDSRTDLFSLGIVLWEMLANDRLFTSNSEAAILRKIRECQIPPIRKINPSVPAELEAIVVKALAKDKTQRYQTAAAFHKDLNRFLNVEYPDFSPQDFSVFIKNCFSDVYSDSKKKLVEYAKVTSGVEEKTQVTQTLTYSPESTSQETSQQSSASMSNITGLPAVPNGSGQEKLDIETETRVKVDLSDLDGKSTAPERARMPKQGKNQPKGNSAGGTRTHVPISTRSQISFNKNSGNDIAIYIVVASVVFGGLFLLYRNSRTPSAKTPAIAKVAAPTPVTKENPKTAEGSTEQSSTQLVTVTISSEPIGARIFIDGREVGQTTPAQVQIPANKDVKLNLDKLGFNSYESTISASENGKTIRATLMGGRTGVLNLALINGGASPEIEINGTKISEQLPLRNYRLPAGVPVVIRVKNSFLGTKAERTIVLDENESKSLELILKPDKAQP
ncbi:MAG: protein kinase domain-containing protein [Bdellovibrionales bacterium]